MLEKMFTTKMSADKKKLQSRFSKIRSKNGKLSQVIGGILFGIIIISIISVGVIIAVNSTKDYRMTDDEFSDYIHRPIGAIMADIDYVDDERLVFHYLDGFFVIDQQNNEIIHRINLSKLNIAGHTQGDCFTVFKVDKDGTFAYLTNEGLNELVGSYDNYIINLKTGEVKIGNAPNGTEFFTNYADTSSTVKNTYGWYSNRCIVDGEQKIYFMTTQDSIIAAIQLVTINRNSGEDVEMRYVFGTDYVSLAQHKANVINESLNEGEEILINSGLSWEVSENGVKAVLNKLSESMQMKKIDVPEGNYEILVYSIQRKDNAGPQLFILNNSTFEILFSVKLEKTVFTEVTSMLEQSKYENFYPKDIYNLLNAELVIDYIRYPLLDKSNLLQIEQMLSGAKVLKGGTACPYTASIILTRADGTQGIVALATDSCAVFKSGDTYYDYSDGDNSELLGYFGFDAETIIDMTAKR